jgi:hypothetical protein
MSEHVPKKSSAPMIIATSSPAERWFLRDGAAPLGGS